MSYLGRLDHKCRSISAAYLKATSFFGGKGVDDESERRITTCLLGSTENLIGTARLKINLPPS